MNNEHTAIYPGTFDPITNGHLDVIRRAVRIFEKVVVVIARNPAKEPMFSIEERRVMIEEAVTDIPGVEVDVLEGLAVEGASKHDAAVLIRGCAP